jgi:8-oxo-dGTP pyrophosphatase MutT (NUDIX family)
MALFARLPVALRRRGYRLAYGVLCIYWFLARPRARGVKCVLTNGDLVLLVRHTYGRPEWDLPGGTVKSSEAPLSAARREMKEELGISGQAWTSLGELNGRSRHRRDTLHCFHAELDNAALTLDFGELQSATWFRRSRLPVDLGEYVQQILRRLE